MALSLYRRPPSGKARSNLMSFHSWSQQLGRKHSKALRGQRLPRRESTTRLLVEPLEQRLAPVVGASHLALAVGTGQGYDGVVQVAKPNVRPCTGSLLFTGRHILTA